MWYPRWRRRVLHRDILFTRCFLLFYTFTVFTVMAQHSLIHVNDCQRVYADGRRRFGDAVSGRMVCGVWISSPPPHAERISILIAAM